MDATSSGIMAGGVASAGIGTAFGNRAWQHQAHLRGVRADLSGANDRVRGTSDGIHGLRNALTDLMEDLQDDRADIAWENGGSDGATAQRATYELVEEYKSHARPVRQELNALTERRLAAASDAALLTTREASVTRLLRHNVGAAIIAGIAGAGLLTAGAWRARQH